MSGRRAPDRHAPAHQNSRAESRDLVEWRTVYEICQFDRVAAMTTTSGGQVRRLRLPAALLTAALIATPAFAAPAFAAPSALETTTVDAAGVEPVAESEPDPAPAPAQAAPVTGESLQQVAVSGVDEKAAAERRSRVRKPPRSRRRTCRTPKRRFRRRTSTPRRPNPIPPTTTSWRRSRPSGPPRSSPPPG